jgi:[methyl-Co(III) methanol-specific corrinoid protein]:coenzyme M methyltransferase
MKSVYDKVAKILSDAFSFDAVVSLREAKKQLPDKVIMGNVSTFAIEMQDEKTVEKLTRSCYSGGSDIISPACGLGMGSPLSNVQTVLRTVRTFSTEEQTK